MKHIPFHAICTHLETNTRFLVQVAFQMQKDAKKEDFQTVIDSVLVITMTLAAIKVVMKPEVIEQMPKYLVSLLRDNIQEIQQHLTTVDMKYAVQLRGFNNFSCWAVLVGTNEILPLLQVKT